jgi:tripartite-type tricarboxylate transporter receptor subunit TctC
MISKLSAATVGALLALTAGTAAQNYPTRSITMVIPFAAGGPTDVLGRVVGARMSQILGQQVVIENVGGGGGQTGSRRVADAKPDGYTMVVGTVGTHAQSQTLYKRPLYNAVTDFTPVALLAEVPIILTVRKDLPVKDFKEFVAYAQKNQAKMQFGSAGAGSATHLGCVLLNLLLKTNINHIPYKGTGPAMIDLAAGRIDFLCEIITTAKPHVDGGTVRALAIFDKERSKALPNLPTALEQGGPKDLIAYTWNAMFLPKNAPADIVKKLNAAAVEAMKSPAVAGKLSGLGAKIATPDQMTPQYLANLVKSEIAKWAVPIKASGAIVN